MNRILLAILALFTGLAAQVSPAEARVCGTIEIGATLGFKPSARVVAVEAARPFRATPQRQAQAEEPGLKVLPLPVQAAPTVRFGPDRARE